MNSSKTALKVEPARHWINGEWIGSSTVANSVSPSTGKVLGQYSAGVTVNSPVVKDEIPERVGVRDSGWAFELLLESPDYAKFKHKQGAGT
jgi:hypothetical protein